MRRSHGRRGARVSCEPVPAGVRRRPWEDGEMCPLGSLFSSKLPRLGFPVEGNSRIVEDWGRPAFEPWAHPRGSMLDELLNLFELYLPRQ